MKITMKCSKCEEVLNGTISVDLGFDEAAMEIVVVPCNCQPEPQMKFMSSASLVSFLKDKTTLRIAFTKKNGEYRILDGRFTGITMSDRHIYVWNDDDECLKAVRLKSVDWITIDNTTYEIF